MRFYSAQLVTVLAAVFIVTACQPDTQAQESQADNGESSVVAPPELRKSPMAVAAETLSDGTYVKVVYSSPRKRGREIFGGLVPYGEVWRTGANEATEITITAPIMLAENRVEAGTYSLFTIPNKESWTIILNGALGQWGAYEYSDEDDVLRFRVPASITDETHEAFTISIETVESESTLHLHWENTKVSLPIRPV